jgi:hypothetical protein
VSLDDLIQDEGEPPTLCDACFAKLDGEMPTVVGWKMLVFTCKICKLDFCAHLEGPFGGTVCVGCTIPSGDKA